MDSSRPNYIFRAYHFSGNMIVKSLEEAMLKVRLGGEIKKEVVEEEQSAVQSKEELFTFKHTM